MIYPKPGPIGGTLIRRVIALLRGANAEIPVDSHILIACSGGADSTALATLICRYGRRIAPLDRISLLHINHGWRGEASDQDERFVARLAKKLGVPVISERLEGASRIPKGESWEEQARLARQAIFAKHPAITLTAHHADDLAETALWRLLTGADATHGGGILLATGRELRPLLTTRKRELLEFLKEEKQAYRKDATNEEDRFLRARMRKRLMPEIERLFPKAVEHLSRRALKLQQSAPARATLNASMAEAPIESLLKQAEIRLRRPHYEKLAEKPGSELHLPGGWKLSSPSKNRWVLEKIL